MSPAELPLHIDSTMRSCFVSCPQKFLLEFVHGLRPPGLSVDLHAGACFALALEATYRGLWEHKRPFDEALAAAHGLFLEAWGDFSPPPYKSTSKTKDRVWEAVESYFATYSPRTDHVQCYFDESGKPTFEFTFAIPLEPACDSEDYRRVVEDDKIPCFPLHPSGQPFLYSGRFDLLGNYNGRPCIRDEKTTGRGFTHDWSEHWSLRAQFLGYTWACQQAGIDLDTVVVRGVAIQKTQIQHTEAIKIYSQFLIDQWHEQLRRDLWRLRRAWDEGYFDYNLGETCTQYGLCQFMPVCSSPPNHRDQWHSNYVVRHWNPLNKNPATEETTA
jgi:hypothetical protein